MNIHQPLRMLRYISRLCRPDTVLATNSSNIVSSKLADVTEHPERLMNIHYFNPALVMELVELVRGPHTGDEAVELARTFAINTGKSPIVLNKEIAGFVANRINAAVVHEALSLIHICSVIDGDFGQHQCPGALGHYLPGQLFHL